MRANQTLRKRGEVAAKGGMLALVVAALVFFSEGQQRQVAQVADGFAANARLLKFCLIEGRVGPDVIKLDAQALVFQLAQGIRRQCFYGFIPVAALHQRTSSMRVSGSQYSACVYPGAGNIMCR